MAHEPEEGVVFIKKRLPHLTNLQAEMAFYALTMRDAQVGMDTVGNDKELDEAYDEYKMWKALQDTGEPEKEAHYLGFKPYRGK